MDLIGKVGEPDVSHEFFADDGRNACGVEGRGRTVGRTIHGGIVSIGSATIVVRHVARVLRRGEMARCRPEKGAGRDEWGEDVVDERQATEGKHSARSDELAFSATIS